MSGPSLLDSLERLLLKYRTLAALRARREQAEGSGLREFDPDEARARAATFQRIAREFPGSLRELDVSRASILEAKARAVEAEIDALRAEPDRTNPGRPWVAIVLDYHATLREALAVKRWLSERIPKGAAVTQELTAEFLEWHSRYAHRHGVLGPPGQSFLESHRRPPDGRIHSLVWNALALRHHLERRDLERAVFGPIHGG